MINMRFLVDESVGKKFSNILKDSGKHTIFAGDVIPEVDDEDVLHFADEKDLILITADKDFGELIFELSKSSAGVILIRTSISDPEKRFEMVKDALDKAEGKFIVVKEGQIRVRNLK